MLHSELLRSGEYVVWVCFMGLVMPQTVLCQAELTDLWSLVCRKNVIVPVSVAGVEEFTFWRVIRVLRWGIHGIS